MIIEEIACTGPPCEIENYLMYNPPGRTYSFTYLGGWKTTVAGGGYFYPFISVAYV
jgi:hypothetical protein